jgi:hypothetical protein
MTTHCPRTREALARAPKELPRTLREHLDECEICADAVAVEGFLKVANSSSPRLDQLPDSTTIWWRSRHLEQQGRIARATQPIRLLERIAFAAGAAGVAIGATMIWPALRSTTANWLDSLAAGARHTASASSGTQVLLFGTAILAMVAVGLYSQWAED